MDLIGLIPSFGNIVFTIGAFIIALSIIVAVHEFGHYIIGRWSGIDAEVFSLGFGPVLLRRTDRRGTVWQIAALPFGGYVRFRGDGDPSGVTQSGDSALSAEERRRTMHGAPLWARSATVAAGPIFNFVLSLLVFATVLLFRGVASEPLTVAEFANLPYAEQGLAAGDEILAIEGRAAPALEELNEFIEGLPAQEVLTYDVARDGREITVQGPFPFPPLVQSVTPGSAADDIGIITGDVILSVDRDAIYTFEQLREKVAGSDGKSLVLSIWRDESDGAVETDFSLVPRRVDYPTESGGFETRWLIGITGGLFFEPESETPGLWTALGYGADQTVYIIKSSLSGLYHMAAGAISSCNLRGPIGIAETSGQAASQGWVTFVWFIAVLSTAVGLLNLFPIPILDGGHLVFHAYEAVSGRPPSDGAMRLLTAIGLALLGSLMLFAISNDLFCP